MKIKTTISSLVAMTMMAACATTYKCGGRFGYHDTRLQENVFSVSFQGNAKCDPQDAQDYALLRCAELCIQNGFKFFTINSSGGGAKTGVYNSGGTANTYGSMRTVGTTAYGSFNTYNSPTVSVPIHMPYYSAIITCYKDKPEFETFDAEYLGKSISEKHGFTFENGVVTARTK